MGQLIGIIKYKAGWFGTSKQEAYEERVLLNDSFDFNELVRIFNEDHTFDVFHIILNEKLIFTTDYRYEKIGYHDGVTAYIDRGIFRQNGIESYILTLWNGQEIDLYKTDIVFREKDCFIPLCKYRRDEEIIGTTYYAFAKTPYKYKKKYTHKAVFCHESTGYYLTKKEALAKVESSNLLAKKIIEICISENKK